MNPSNYLDISLFGLRMNPPRSFEIFGLSIHFYGLIIACGLLLAVWYGCKRCNQFGFSVDDLTDGVLCIVPFAILCARLYYCIFDWDSYKNDPISILYIWNGGLAIYGGVIGAAIGVIVFSKVKKIKIGAVLDIVALGFLIGQAIGRWGNFFNREAFGAATDSFMKMGLFNRFTQSWEYYHPTFLYESLWNAAGFVLLHFLSKRRKYDGQIALGYAAWYGLGRTFIEGLRTDSLYWGPFRVSQMLAAISCLIATSILIWNAFRDRDPEKLYVNQVAARNAAAEAEAAALEAEVAEEVPETAEETTEEISESAEETTEA